MTEMRMLVDDDLRTLQVSLDQLFELARNTANLESRLGGSGELTLKKLRRVALSVSETAPSTQISALYAGLNNYCVEYQFDPTLEQPLPYE